MSRQLAEVQYLNKSLELERSNLASQNQGLQADLAQSYDKQHALSKKVASCERQLTDASRYDHGTRAGVEQTCMSWGMLRDVLHM